MDLAINDSLDKEPAVVLDVKYNYDDGKVVISTTPTKGVSPNAKTPDKSPKAPPASNPPLKIIPTPPKRRSKSGGGFLGTTASCSFRRRAALDRIKLFSQTKTQAKDDNSTSYVLVGGAVRQISPHSKAELQQREHDSLQEESRILFASDDTSICSLASSSVRGKPLLSSPRRPRTTSISSSTPSTPKSTKKVTPIDKIVPFVASAPTLSSTSKQRALVSPPNQKETHTMSVRHTPPSHISSGFLVTPSPLSATAALRKKIQAARTAAKRKRDGLSIPALISGIRSPKVHPVGSPLQVTPRAKVLSSPPRATSTATSYTGISPRHEERSPSPATLQPTKPSRVAPPRRYINAAVAIVSPTMSVQPSSVETKETRIKQSHNYEMQSLTSHQLHEDSPKGDDWADVYSYFCDPAILGDGTPLDSKSDESLTEERANAPAAIITSNSKDCVILPVMSEANDPESVYGTMASMAKVGPKDKVHPSRRDDPVSPSSLDYSSGGESSSQASGPYKIFAAESQPDDEFWSRVAPCAKSPITDEMTSMELIHHASYLLRVYFATLALQRWWLELQKQRQQQWKKNQMGSGVQHLADIAEVNEYGYIAEEDEAQWEDLNLIGAAMTLQIWWRRVSPEKQRHERMDTNADQFIRCISSESSVPNSTSASEKPISDPRSQLSPGSQRIETTPVILGEPQTSRSAPFGLRNDDLESRAAVAQGALEDRLMKASKLVELHLDLLKSSRLRGFQERKREFSSAIDKLSRIQEQNISLWKARYSRGEKVRAAKVLQGWWRWLGAACTNGEPVSASNLAGPAEVSSITKLQNWWRMIVAQRNYDHLLCVVSLLPGRTKDVMRSKIEGPNLWGSLTRSRIKSQKRP